MPIAFIIINVVPFVSSSQQHLESIGSPTNNEENILKVSRKVMFEITVHGIILWASMGFLILSVLMVTAGALMSIKNFNNSFNNYHQRLGVAIYGIIWVQALTAALRSFRGSKARSAWFFTHWLVGTAVCILGVINIYTGLGALHEKTIGKHKTLDHNLTAQICLMVFIYLFQDKWLQLQLQKQEEPVPRREPVRPYPYRTRQYAAGINY
ncbi:TRNA-methyltransferase [Hibiscus syriacus]|uniref:tRNA-methyltransferase n=1 Tax=Hibiscus syriacus TaxID=106335 RepID=A0A6A2WCS0_HIBSY|nr:TRNA-methyltransferase [Hibiscus syriacus]